MPASLGPRAGTVVADASGNARIPGGYCARVASLPSSPLAYPVKATVEGREGDPFYFIDSGPMPLPTSRQDGGQGFPNIALTGLAAGQTVAFVVAQSQLDALFLGAGGFLSGALLDASGRTVTAADNGQKATFFIGSNPTPANSGAGAFLCIERGPSKTVRIRRVIWDPGTFITTAAGLISINLTLYTGAASAGGATSPPGAFRRSDVFSGTVRVNATAIGTVEQIIQRQRVTPAAITPQQDIVFDFAPGDLLKRNITLEPGGYLGMAFGFASIGAGGAGSSAVHIEFTEE